ncbi:hypothetical protein Vretimale_8925 [Volvox reticuliferus]|uniref:Uncharacterized protein n=2 Tax=Volvox reticuliferus TaxID=1737510 RepID=A0A8J4LPU5_9CHLO|nr:hypothetical protein Vretimale_8925 [Volvox reticuliferus]
MKQIILAVLLAVVVGTASATDADQNSWSFMLRRKSTCANTYTTLIESKYYANNVTCKANVKLALQTYNKTACPDTKQGSLVWTCMSGFDSTTNQTNSALINDWTAFLSGCEVLYIADRANTAESESGFVWLDNSCFGRYVNMNQFVNYLRGTGDSGGNAEMNVIRFFHIMIAVVAAMFLAQWQSS